MKKIFKIISVPMFCLIISFTLLLEVSAKLYSTSNDVFNGRDHEYRLEGNNSSGGRSEYFCLTKGSKVDSTCDIKYDKNDKSYGDNNEQLRVAIGRAIYDYNTLHSKHVVGPEGSTSNAGPMYYGIQLVIHKILAEKEGLSGLSGALAFNGWDFTPHYDAAIDDYNAYNSSVSVSNLSFTQSDDYFVSNVISPSSGFGTGFSYSLTINGVSNSTYLKSVTGGKRIEIPISAVTSDMKVSLIVSTTRTFYKANFIDCAEGTQDVVNTSYIKDRKKIEKEISATLKPVSGTMTIKKVKQDGTTPIQAKYVTFDVFSSRDCSGTATSKRLYTGNNGEASIALSKVNQDYSIRETEAPDGYDETGECIYVGYLTPGGTISTTVTNKTQCEIDFESDSSIKNRLKLYGTYGYRNLLNFTISSSSSACSNFEPTYSPSESCMYVDKVGQTVKDGFNQNNLSNYNETISASSTTGQSYCLTDFELKSNVSFNDNVTAGRLVLEGAANGEALTGTLTKTCYIHKDEINNYNIEYVEGSYRNLNRFMDAITEEYYYSNNAYIGISVPSSYQVIVNETTDSMYVIDFPKISRYYIPLNQLESTTCENENKYYNLVNGLYYCVRNNITNKLRKYSYSNNKVFYRNTTHFIADLNYIINAYTEVEDGIYVIKSDLNDYNNYYLSDASFVDYKNYISDIKLDGLNLNIENIENTKNTLEAAGEFYKVTGTTTIVAKLNPVYAEKMTGKTIEDVSSCFTTNKVGEKILKQECRFLGYGVASKFKDAKSTTSSSFNFSITPSSNSIFTFNSNNECPYTVTPEIIEYEGNDGKLELEFRTVDTNAPFSRDPNSNWDGIVDETNKSIIEQYITDTNVNNSYNRTRTGSLYTNQTDSKKIILTPDLVQQIRDYNDRMGSYEKSEYEYNETTGKWENVFFKEQGIIKN